MLLLPDAGITLAKSTAQLEVLLKFWLLQRLVCLAFVVSVMYATQSELYTKMLESAKRFWD